MRAPATFFLVVSAILLQAQEKVTGTWWQGTFDEDKVYLDFSSNFKRGSYSFTVQRFASNWIAYGCSYGAGIEIQPEDHSVHPRLVSRVWAGCIGLNNSLICYYPGQNPELRLRSEIGFTFGGVVFLGAGRDFRLLKGNMEGEGLKSTTLSIIVPVPIYNVKTGKWGLKG